MRPVIKTEKKAPDGTPLTYKHWGDAKIPLQKELGSYCSFCERPGYRASLDVEHILSKDIPRYKNLTYRWDNFLLGCKNCNPIKSNKDYDIDETYMPHLNNLMVTMDVLEGGAICLKNNLPQDQQKRARNFVDLVGLDRDPAHPQYSVKDDRWEQRIDAWNTATDFLSDYEKKEIKLTRVIQMARAAGFWSIWMTVFKNHPEVKKELIATFPGTASNCFSKDSIPLPRNGGNP